MSITQKDFIQNKINTFFKECEAIKIPNNEESTMFECSCCYEECTYDKSYVHKCGHRLCLDCWKEHINCSIKNSSEPIHCIECKELIDLKEAYVVGLFENKEVVEKFIRDSLIRAEGKNFCICPKCHTEVYSTDDKVICPIESCKTEICKRCCHEYHEGKTCEKISKSNEIDNENILLSLQWIQKNTKKCPQCSAKIIKHVGCNNVKCLCGYHFCWCCGDLFTGYDHYFHNNTKGCVIYDKSTDN